MFEITDKIDQTDWQAKSQEINTRGYTCLPGFLSLSQCREFIARFDQIEEYRKTVVMERYRFGLGAYKYWDYPLPEPVQCLRENLYPKLAPIANHWMELLDVDQRFPKTLDGLLSACHRQGQQKPTPLILQYAAGGYNTLHQDLYGDLYFPIQAACFLSEPDEDYTGGEFVLTQQVPRAQTKAMVLKPKRGDLIIFTTHFRPVKGTRGYYRALMKHGVSEVHHGTRHTLGIIFHDAVS